MQDKLKFEPPAASYRAVRLDAVRAEVTCCLRVLPAKLKFELPRYRYRALRTDTVCGKVTNCLRPLAGTSWLSALPTDKL